MTTFIIISIVLATLIAAPFVYIKANKAIKLRREQAIREWCYTAYYDLGNELLSDVEPVAQFLASVPHKHLSAYKKLLLKWHFELGCTRAKAIVLHIYEGVPLEPPQ